MTMKVLLGQKLGMTSFISQNGKIYPVTVIQAGPCYVTQIKDNKSQKSFQIGFKEIKKLNKPLAGHLKDKKLKHLKEFPVKDENEEIYQLGATIDLSILDPKSTIDISGNSKGKGFAGSVKRHNYSIGPKSHGSKHHRRVGATGGRYPQHTTKGRKMPGHMGNAKTTIKNLTIVKIDPAQNMLLVKGSIPGNNNRLLIIKQK
ncbi:50S ribosomal protein L3 [Patescibacteria group bacterium]|nr:50S ribosomal protein L3 [Patescibacteria group bacterium]